MMLLRRHDRYVLQAFASAFGAVIVFFTVIVIVIHMSDRLARVVRYWTQIRDQGYSPPAVLVEYYATLIPFIWMQIVPLATVLAAAFALTRLTRSNELSPLVTAGVSTRRITAPILVAGVAIGGLLFGLQELLVPQLSRRNMTLERLLNEAEPQRVTRIPHFDDPGGARLSAAAFRPFDLAIEGVLLTIREPGGRVAEIRAYPLLRWDEGAGWVAEGDGTRFSIPPDGTTAQRNRIPASDPLPLESDLNLFEVSALKDAALGLSTRESAALVAAAPGDPRLLYLHHTLFARCLVPLLLLLVGLPSCLVLSRRSAIPATLAVLGAGTVYYALGFLTSSLAGSGLFNPAYLAWFPVATFGSVGLGLWLAMDS